MRTTHLPIKSKEELSNTPKEINRASHSYIKESKVTTPSLKPSTNYNKHTNSNIIK